MKVFGGKRGSEPSKPKAKTTRSWTGYLLAFMSSMSNAGGAFFFKEAGENKLRVVLIRNMFQFLIFIPIMTYAKIDFWGSDTKTNLLLLLRAILSPIVMSLLGTSMNYLTLGDAIAIFYIYPALVGIFAWICIKEKCGILNIAFTIISLIGFVLVAQPPFIFGYAANDVHFTPSRIVGALLGFSAAVLAANVCVILRKLGSDVHFALSMMYSAWAGVLFSVVFMACAGESVLPCYHELAPITGVSIFYSLGMVFQVMALQREKAGPVTILQTNQVIFSFLLQYIVYGVIPNIYCAIGASLIFISCIALAMKGILKSRQETIQK